MKIKITTTPVARGKINRVFFNQLTPLITVPKIAFTLVEGASKENVLETDRVPREISPSIREQLDQLGECPLSKFYLYPDEFYFLSQKPTEVEVLTHIEEQRVLLIDMILAKASELGWTSVHIQEGVRSEVQVQPYSKYLMGIPEEGFYGSKIVSMVVSSIEATEGLEPNDFSFDSVPKPPSLRKAPPCPTVP